MFHEAVFALPLVKCRLTDAVIAANLIHRLSLILFRQYLHNLNLCKFALFHLSQI